MVNLKHALVAASYGVASIAAGPLIARTATETQYTATKTVTLGGPTITSGWYTITEYAAYETSTTTVDCTALFWVNQPKRKRQLEPTVTVTTDKTVTVRETEVCTIQQLVTTEYNPGTSTDVRSRCSWTLTSSFTVPATWTSTSTKYGTWSYVTSTTLIYVTYDGTRVIYPPEPTSRTPQGPQQPKPTLPANPPLPSDAFKTTNVATSTVNTLSTTTLTSSFPVEYITSWVTANPTTTITSIYYEQTITPVVSVTLKATTCDQIQTTPLDPCRFVASAPAANALALGDYVVTATPANADFGIAAAAATPTTVLRTYTVIEMRGNTVTATKATTYTFYTCPPKATTTK